MAHAGAIRLSRLRQEGSARAFLPSVHDPVPEIVFLNTAGGLTGGDALSYSLHVGAEAAAVATTQTAERGYASAGGTARLDIDLHVGAGGWLDWLPQETILYDGAALDRRTEIALGRDAACVAVETLVLGRAAMREVVVGLSLKDVRIVRRDGHAIAVESVRLDDSTLQRARQPALLRGARAIGSAILAAPGADDAAAAVSRLRFDGVEVAASGWNGKCVVRLLGGDGWPVRRAMIGVMEVLRGGRPLPRVWRM